MKLNSEQKKLLYLVASENDKTKDLVPLLKEDLVTAGQMTNENAELKKQLEDYDGLDIAGLKSKAEFVDSKGGVDAIIGTYSKHEGYDNDIDRVKREKEEYKAKYETEVKASKSKDDELKTLRLNNAIGDTFSRTFKSSLVQKDCIETKKVYMSEDGTPWVNTPEGPKPLGGDGLDYLKRLSEYSGLLNVPSGTNDPLSAPGNDNEKIKKFEW